MRLSTSPGDRISLLLASLLLVIGSGCAGAKKPPPPLEPPAVSHEVSYRPGGPVALSATTRPAGAIPAADALALRVTWLALSRDPKGFRPLLADATLIAAPRSAEPFMAAGQLSRGAQMVPAEKVERFLADLDRGAFGQRATIASSDAALPRDVTTTFALGNANQRIEIDLHRPAQVTTQPQATQRATTAAMAPAATMPANGIQLSFAFDDAGEQRERLVLASRPMPPPARFALLLPSRFGAPRVKAIAAIVELSPPSDSPEHRQAVADCAEQLQRFAAGRLSAPGVSGPSGWSGLATALRAMRQPAISRVAMVYLAGQTGAELFGDVALVAPDPTLVELSTRIQQRLGDTPAAMEPPQLGWQLEVVTLEQLAELQSTEKLPSELAGVLARYAGEAARNAGSLEELTRVKGRQQLQSRLIAENFTYLEDASPSARVRAYDWLRARGRAPAKYDPLGPPKERAAGIDAALATDATTTPATQTQMSIGGAP